ncbi:MAG: NFACT family protein, partial [Nanoarchaeota archaeon]|nr:NFACT family protein [Nanoarchaeota archaeon]
MVKYYLSALDFLKWIEEIGPYINGGRLRDVRSEKGELFILIYNGEDYWIRVVPGSHILIQREKPTNTEQFKFNQKIKDELYNKKVEIKMHDSDRIIELVSGNIRLIFELFSNGNVLLVKDDKIVWAMFYRDYVSRKIGAGESYKYPAETFNWLELSRDSFLETVKRSNKGSLVKALAVDISLGGQYSTEICFRAGLKGDESITSLSDETLTKLYDILERIIKEEKRPNIINDSIFSSI